ncbi:hypothetical protein [Jiella sp. M17.18]|uniref:hypothetical protein n=1 Tax=Jiella sp. M17.18 TaxID=3234247 RepID=UPI0034DF80D0
MFLRPSHPALSHDTPKAAAEVVTLLTMSPFIIGTRMMQFWMRAASTPTAGGDPEASRMVSEKIEAAGESLAAMNAAVAKAAGETVMAAMTGRPRAVNDADAILTAGLKPFSKRVKANHRRLSR